MTFNVDPEEEPTVPQKETSDDIAQTGENDFPPANSDMLNHLLQELDK